MPTKKTAKSAAKPAAKTAKKAAPAPAKKAAPAKAGPRPAAKAKPAPKPAPKAKAVKSAPKPPAKKAAPKAAPKPAAAAKAKPAPAPKPVKAAKPGKAETLAKAPAKSEAKPQAKAAAAPKAKPAKPPKPVKLAPVEAAFAKPKPAKPLAVAAGRASPVSSGNGSPPPARPLPPPKTLLAPKPVAEPELVGDAQPVPAFKGKASAAKGMVLVGAIAGAFGVKGEVRLRAFTEKKDGVIAYGPLYGEDGKVLLKPKTWRELKDGVAVAAPEVKTKEQADKMRGQRLYVPRANLPPTAEDEFYIVDLLGCRAEALDGKVLGEIVAVWNFGAGDIIEYRPQNGGPNVRITFTRESAPLVDLAGKRVVLDPPAPEPEPVGK